MCVRICSGWVCACRGRVCACLRVCACACFFLRSVIVCARVTVCVCVCVCVRACLRAHARSCAFFLLLPMVVGVGIVAVSFEYYIN